MFARKIQDIKDLFEQHGVIPVVLVWLAASLFVAFVVIPAVGFILSVLWLGIKMLLLLIAGVIGIMLFPIMMK